MVNCKECGWELEDKGSGRYRCTNPKCKLAKVDVDETGNKLPPEVPPKPEIVELDEVREMKKKLRFTGIAPIAEKLLPYLAATVDSGLNPQWKEVGVSGNPSMWFDPWFLDDVCINTGLGVRDIEYFCRILKPSARLKEIPCEYSTPNRDYRFKKRRIALSPAFVSHLKSIDFGSGKFSGTGMDMLRAYFLLCKPLEPFESLSDEFDDENWRWAVEELERSHSFSPLVLQREKTVVCDGNVKEITLFWPNHFYVWQVHYFGSQGRERGPPQEEERPIDLAGHPAFSNSISGLKREEIARQLKAKLPRKLEDLRMSKASLLKLRESFEKGNFLKENEYEPQVLEELQEKGLIDVEGGMVIPSFSEYGLGDFIEEKDSEIVRELKTWLDLPDE